MKKIILGLALGYVSTFLSDEIDKFRRSKELEDVRKKIGVSDAFVNVLVEEIKAHILDAVAKAAK